MTPMADWLIICLYATFLCYNETLGHFAVTCSRPGERNMQHYLFIIILSFLYQSKNHVMTHRTLEVAAGAPDSAPPRNRSDIKDERGNKVLDTSEKGDKPYVYLEDIFYALKSQDWREEELSCLNQTLLLLHGLQNFTLWAVWNWDAVSSEPQGLLYGSRYQLGNFDECIEAPWASTHPELRSKYCLADVVLESSGRATKHHLEPNNPYQSALNYMQHHPAHFRPLNKLTWGVCVPASCEQLSVERLLRTVLSRSHLGTTRMKPSITFTEPCQTSHDTKDYDGAFYGFICLVAASVAAVLICTCLNTSRRRAASNAIKYEVIKAFCLKENSKNLLKMKKDGIEVLYGIRFLTICLIVVDHQIGMFNGGPVSNGLQVDQEMVSPLGMLILHNDLFVDTFFWMSGLLAATALTNLKTLPNPCLIILKRYVRLAVGFGVVILYVCAMYAHTGSGPLWPRAVDGEVAPCRDNWWLSLLMLNNYIDDHNICLVTSWYIPCDFHFFVAAVLLYWVYRRRPRLGLAVAAAVTAAAVGSPAIINYANDLPPVQFFTYDFLVDPRGNKQFRLSYIKSHARCAAYIVGFYTGCIHCHYRAARAANVTRISQKWSVLGVCLGLIIMVTVMLTGTVFLWRSYQPIEGAVYAALNRPAWAAGLGLLVLCCSLGQVPLVKQFLSWYPWVPLSRLTYGLYLTHSLFILRNVFVARNPRHNDLIQQTQSAAGILFLGCLAALLIWVFAEAPVNNLLELCLKMKRKGVLGKENEENITIQASAGGPFTAGHLQSNLPSNVALCSKM